MVLHSLRSGTDKDSRRLREILGMRTKQQTLIDEAIELIKKTKSLEYSRNMGYQLVTEAWKNIEKELPNTQGKQKLKLLGEFTMARSI